MSWGKIRLEPADIEFSIFIRLRDGKCQRCFRLGETNSKGDGIIGLQNSHFFGRGKRNTRFDPENCDALCARCHLEWGSNDTEAYREFKIKQLGEKGFKDLRIRSLMYQKKDKKLELIVAREMTKELRKNV